MTSRSTFTNANIAKACESPDGATAFAESIEISKYPSRCRAQQPPIDFKPMGLGYCGAVGPRPRAMKLMKEIARNTDFSQTERVIHEGTRFSWERTSSSVRSVKIRIYQKPSYAIWSTYAASVICRAPPHVEELDHPLSSVQHARLNFFLRRTSHPPNHFINISPSR